MNILKEKLLALYERYIVSPLSDFGWTDALDILLLTALLYCVYSFVRVRRAGKLAVGILGVLLLYVLSDILGMRAMYQILSALTSFGIIIIVIIFQSELREVLEKIGSITTKLRTSGNAERADLAHTVSEVVDAACQIAQTEGDGALIVIERSTKLGDIAAKGQPLNAEVSCNLLRNIFVNRAPLHDGAVIISKNRIVAASCKLPLTDNEEVSRGLGTRHRAAIGITEVSDCVVVVVSEERNIISVANAGLLKRDYNRSAEDFKDEERLKEIQNSLRQDLFKLLGGGSYDDTDRTAKRKRRRMGKTPDAGNTP